MQGELKSAPFGMRTNNPIVRGKPRHADTKADLIFKRVFYNYLLVVGTDVGCGLVRTLFLSLILFLVQLYFVMLVGCQLIGVHDGLAWVGATNTSGREPTRGPCALKQKYHLPSKC